jgi:hypothetical protein
MSLENKSYTKMKKLIHELHELTRIFTNKFYEIFLIRVIRQNL